MKHQEDKTMPIEVQNKKIKRITTKKGVNYAVRFMPRSFWFQQWKPMWHKGRGRYITVGLYLIAFYRGY